MQSIERMVESGQAVMDPPGSDSQHAENPAAARERPPITSMLRRLRGTRTLRQVEADTGISNAYLSNIESGAKRPGVKILSKLAAYYRFPLGELLQAAGLPFDENATVIEDSNAELQRIYEFVIADPNFMHYGKPVGTPPADVQKFVIPDVRALHGQEVAVTGYREAPMPREMTNRAITIARTSGRSQDERLSHSGQDTVMSSYCKKKSLDVIRAFYEVASGLDANKRPDFLEGIRFALDPENRIGHVVFHDLSRFSRSKADPHTYMKLLDEHDIIIHSALEETNSDDDNELYWDVSFIFNNQFSRTVSNLTIRGHTESVKMGNDISPVVAYGFEKYYVKDGKKWRPRWKPHPEHSKVVLLIFRMRAQKYLPMDICNHLNGLKIPPPKGELWTTGTIRAILRNLAYIGYSQVGKKPTSVFPKHRRRRPLVQNPHAHPAIVPLDLFQKVQDLMPKKPRVERDPPRSHDSPNPLSNKVKCRDNGHEANMVVGNSKENKKKLTCSVKKNSGIKYCKTEDIELDDFLKTMGASLKQRLSNPSIVREQLETLVRNSGEHMAQEKERQAAITKRLKEIGHEKTNLMTALQNAKEDFPENVSDFNSSLSVLNKEKEQLTQQQREMDEEASDLMAFLADPEGLVEAIQELGEQIDPAQKFF